MIGTRSLAPGRSVPEALLRTRPAIDEGLRRAVGRLSPEIRPIAEYHLGWRDAAGSRVDGDGGKAVRPAIALVAAEAVGGLAADAVAGAVALELVHDFSLIHDDVMDGDRERRHRPTVWALFGTGAAIVAGDAMLSLAHELLLADPPPRARRAAGELARATSDMIRGQAEDLSFESRDDVAEDECLAMCSHKTGALLAGAGTIGAVLGGGDDTAVEALRTYGRSLGISFQAVDDVLGIWGDPAVTGKPAASDLTQHKKTLPVVHALTTAGREAAGTVVGLDRFGAREWTLAVAERHLRTALEALDGAGLRADRADDLRDIALFVTRRDF